MDLALANQHIRTALERMKSLYNRAVFDEWAVLSFAAKNGGVLTYSGPRPDEFRRQLPADVAPLRELAAGRTFEIGDFEFALDAAGPNHDALMKIGANSFLVCNNTARTMAEIRADARWLRAQAAFFELGERFRVDPLA
jgi:hypothetical protein